MRSRVLYALVTLQLAIGGCGPLGPSPLPARFSPEGQKEVDDAWTKALDPPDRLSAQELLDVLLLSHAFEAGVDRLSFRSEKDLPNGKAIMSVEFDRRHPESDRFTFVVLDTAGAKVREERFDRSIVEATFRTFGERHRALLAKKEHGTATQAELAELAAIEARLDAARHRMPESLWKKKEE